MKILLVHNRYQQRGGEDAVFDDESALLEGHADVVRHVVDNRDLSPWLGPLLTAWRLPWSRPSYRRLTALLRAERPDVVHFHNIFPQITVSAYDACRDLGIPVVQTLHNFRIWCAAGTFYRSGAICRECVDHGPDRAVRYRCYRGSGAGSRAVVRMQRSAAERRVWTTRVDRFIALTPFAKKTVIELGLPADRVVVKPNFCRPPTEPRSTPGDSALFVGRLAPEKGVEVAVRAFLEMPGRRLRIAGSGPEEGALRSLAGGAPNIEFLGAVPPGQVESLMRASAFLIVPSLWYEMFPRVVVEAFAMRLPVVASRLGSLADIVVDGETGALFEAGDAGDLRRCCERLLADGNANATLGLQAGIRHDRDYSPKVSRDALLRIYGDATRRAQ